MDWRVGLCNGSTCWLIFTDWCIDVLVGVLDQHVGWHLLLNFALADVLVVYWFNVLVDVNWCIGVLVDVLCRHVCWGLLSDALTCWLVCWIDLLISLTALLNAIVVDQLLPLFIKRNKKKNYIFITYSILIESFHSAAAESSK